MLFFKLVQFNAQTRDSRSIDGSASKPMLVQDVNYVVEKTYHISPYLGAFGAFLMTQGSN